MNDQPLMRVLHRFAHLPEQTQAVGHGKPVLVAVLVDGRALDELHHEIRHTVFCRPAVQQLADVRMLQRGQDLSLVLEPPDFGLGVHAAADHLDRNTALERAIRAPGQVDSAHAAVPDAGLDGVGADDPADIRIRIVVSRPILASKSPQQRCRRGFEKALGIVV